MPTVLPSPVLVSSAKSQTNAAPFAVVVLLSLLFAGTIWAAGTTKPLTEPTTAAMQGGL